MKLRLYFTFTCPLLLLEKYAMVEPLLHFVVPFAALRAVRLEWREALFTSIVALLPDLDVLFRVHRSIGHSLIVLLIMVLPVLAVSRHHKTIRRLILLATLGVLTHLALDLFYGFTPVFWPLSSESFQLAPMLNLNFAASPTIVGSFRLLTLQQTEASQACNLSTEAPIITGDGLAISAVLLIPTFAEVAMNRINLLRKLRSPKQGS
jgi:hypothetical protein